MLKLLMKLEELVTLFELMSGVGSMNARVTTAENNISDINNQMSVNENRLKLLEYKSIDAEARSRRNNLIFRGLSESPDPQSENCEERIQEILRSDLGLEFDPVVQRAHRMGPIKRRRFRIVGQRANVGQRQDPPPPRPIIVCFRDYKDVLVILENAHKLRGTTIGINLKISQKK